MRLELEVERLTRTADSDWLRRPRVELHYDNVTVRRNDDAQSFQQLCLHARTASTVALNRLASAFELAHDLRPATTEPRDRAEMLVKWSRREEPAYSDSVHRVPGAMRPNQPAPSFLNPELSLLSFQMRVLAMAEDPATPLAERLRFLSIVAANMDEFFMVRMAGLKRAAQEQSEEQCEDGLTHGEQLELIVERVSQIVERQSRCYLDCEHELGKLGVRVLRWGDLNDAQRSALRAEFHDGIMPALTPLAMTLSPGHRLPHLPHLTLALAVVLRRADGGRLHLAELELPGGSRFLRPGGEFDFVPIEEVVRANLDAVYPGSRVEGAYLFRVTRGGDLALDEEAAADLVDAVAEATDRRPENPAVRVEVERGIPAFARDLVLESLRREPGAGDVALQTADVQEVDGLLDLRALTEIEVPDAPGIRYPPLRGAEPIPAGTSFFEVMGGRDLLFHHPFESFESTVVRFLGEASADPDVVAIKITLYRVGSSSRVVDMLLDAAKQGKQVAAFVELKARFDEEHNVAWARKLERAGGHVVSGLVGLKNHAKVVLVVRREGGKLRRYVHVGTGNYNSGSGLQYTDLSLFSAREAIASDVTDLFNALTGGSSPPRGLSRGALVSPGQILDETLRQIEREAALARAGRPARITAKLNGLSDAEVVRALYGASCDGVEIDLIVRGICTLRPGVAGLSGRIRVVSVVGRFLEHSRIYRFGNDGAPQYLIGSSDLRPRNLRRRIELLVPVLDPDHQKRLDRVLTLYLNDPTAWELKPDGEYVRRTRRGAGAQQALIALLARQDRAPTD